MIIRAQSCSSGSATLLFLVLLMPPVKQALEASLTAQVLVQIPLLIAVGWLLRAAVPERILARTENWNYRGIAGLVLATLTAAYWMLPRVLDAATTVPLLAVAKYLSAPLLIGLPFALSWPRMGFIVRGVLLAELIATCFRLGWLYLASPVRLCNNYLLNDQQRLGECMLAIGSGLLFWLAWKLLWGRFDSLKSAA
ncbi:hypothetical protein [Nitrococcus mobilis]|uniref:Putative transmembrane protein n=1 Tax=Nitrococcus mobilis Nb-231 TaxID=314278 RepID=A4BSP5_9GAMM|nr:hypothetical protein [Nitrococcus mobilis]EAR21315.1 putative transmembrane protein [Nitrococcus mobilis Nb-231]